MIQYNARFACEDGTEFDSLLAPHIIESDESIAAYIARINEAHDVVLARVNGDESLLSPDWQAGRHPLCKRIVSCTVL